MLHGALPCTPWSQIHRLNEHVHGPSFTEKLKRSQKKSLRMVRNFLQIAKSVIEREGLVSFEWPPTAGGWKEDIVLKMVESFGLKVEFHGCAVGVKARNGEPMKKPLLSQPTTPILQTYSKPNSANALGRMFLVKVQKQLEVDTTPLKWLQQS